MIMVVAVATAKTQPNSNKYDNRKHNRCENKVKRAQHKRQQKRKLIRNEITNEIELGEAFAQMFKGEFCCNWLSPSAYSQ